MKLKRRTSPKILPLIIICVVAIASLSIYLRFSYLLDVLSVDVTNALNIDIPDKPVTEYTLPITINADGQFLHEKTLINIEELEENIQRAINKYEDSRKVAIVINVEENVPIEHVVSVMDLALKMKIGAILATESK